MRRALKARGLRRLSSAVSRTAGNDAGDVQLTRPLRMERTDYRKRMMQTKAHVVKVRPNRKGLQQVQKSLRSVDWSSFSRTSSDAKQNSATSELSDT